MATELNIGDVLSVRLEYKDTQNTVAYNIMHYRLANATPQGSTPPFDGLDMEQVGPVLASSMFTVYSSNWADFSSNKASMTGTTVQNIYPTPKSRQFHFIPTTAVPGTVTGDMLPLQDSAVLVKRSSFGQRWGIVRFFLVGIPESSQSEGLVSDAYAAAANTFGDFFDESRTLVVGGYLLVLVPIIFGQPAGQPVRKLDIVEFALADKVIKTQRRRRPGKGI